MFLKCVGNIWEGNWALSLAMKLLQNNFLLHVPPAAPKHKLDNMKCSLLAGLSHRKI